MTAFAIRLPNPDFLYSPILPAFRPPTNSPFAPLPPRAYISRKFDHHASTTAAPATIHRDAKQGATLRGSLTEQIMPVYEKRTLPMTASVAQICAGLHIPDPLSERDAWMAAAARDNRQAPCQARGDDAGCGR